MKNRVSNLPTTRIFDNNETNIISPPDDKYANGWEYLDKAFCEYFNFFWNDTSKNFNKINPFLNDFNDEITNMVSLMKSEGMTDSSFDTAQNNWFGKVGQWLSQRIKEEASNRESSITSESNTLKNLISSEQSARISADEALQKAIDKEVGDRQNADNELKTYINGKVPQATSSVAGIMKLFTSLGQNTDGAPTNKAVQDAISAINTLLNGKANSSHTHTSSNITDLYNGGSKTSPGWAYLPNGSIINWGEITCGAETAYINFAKAYSSSSSYFLFAQMSDGSGIDSQYVGAVRMYRNSATALRLVSQNSGSHKWYWFTIGW